MKYILRARQKPPYEKENYCLHAVPKEYIIMSETNLM